MRFKSSASLPQVVHSPHSPHSSRSPGPPDPPGPPHAWLAPLAALDAPESRADPADLGKIWDSVVQGRLRPLSEIVTNNRVCLVSQVIGRPEGLSPEDASLVVNVLCGEPRKAIASELSIALSTATGRFLRALTKLELADRNVPLPLVLAAQCRVGGARIRSGRRAAVDYEDNRSLALSVPRPVTRHLVPLTPSEQEIAQWLIEGFTRYEIADRRETSVHTVAGQFHSIFATLHVTGRYELIRRAVELGCFDEPATLSPSERLRAAPDVRGFHSQSRSAP
jgi:DNA-binding NarL/FixJ family response regulator